MQPTPKLDPIKAEDGVPSYQKSPTPSNPSDEGLLDGMLPYDLSEKAMMTGEEKTLDERKNMHLTYLSARDRYWGKRTEPQAAVDKSKLTPEGRAHRERVKNLSLGNAEVPSVDRILAQIKFGKVHQPRQQVMIFSDAKQIVTALYERELLRKNKTIRLSEDEEAVVDDVLRYFIGDPDTTIPMHKGIFLYGDVGVGKTFLMETMQEMMRLIPIPLMQFGVVEAKAIIDEVKQAKSLQPMKAYNRNSWLIDDMGEEEVKVKLWKDDVEYPMDRLLSTLYRQFTKHDLRTHATSNKEPKELETYYGTRIFDRFGDMFEAVLWPGNDSKRQEPEDPETDE